MKWQRSEISFRLVDEVTAQSVATIAVDVSGGVISIMGEPRAEGRTLVVSGVHVSAQGIVPNDVGLRNSRLIAQIVMETMDYDRMIVEGAVRSTGANPGHRPRPLRFTRSRCD
jgi:hypothetical protein